MARYMEGYTVMDEAARRRDLLIAERILDLPPELLHTTEGGEVRGEWGRIAPVAHYTRDMGAAWQVIEATRRKGVHWDVTAGDWGYSVTALWQGVARYNAERVTDLPDAICTAALVVLGIRP